MKQNTSNATTAQRPTGNEELRSLIIELLKRLDNPVKLKLVYKYVNHLFCR